MLCFHFPFFSAFPPCIPPKYRRCMHIVWGFLASTEVCCLHHACIPACLTARPPACLTARHCFFVFGCFFVTLYVCNPKKTKQKKNTRNKSNPVTSFHKELPVRTAVFTVLCPLGSSIACLSSQQMAIRRTVTAAPHAGSRTSQLKGGEKESGCRGNNAQKRLNHSIRRGRISSGPSRHP